MKSWTLVHIMGVPTHHLFSFCHNITQITTFHKLVKKKQTLWIISCVCKSCPYLNDLMERLTMQASISGGNKRSSRRCRCCHQCPRRPNGSCAGAAPLATVEPWCPARARPPCGRLTGNQSLALQSDVSKIIVKCSILIVVKKKLSLWLNVTFYNAFFTEIFLYKLPFVSLFLEVLLGKA